MKTNLKKLFLLAIILWTPNLVKAASSCSYSEQAELNDIVANVKATYEVVDIYAGKALDIDNPDENGNIPEIDRYVKGFNITILNITDDIYVIVKNSKNGNTQTFYNKDAKDNTVTFQSKDTNSLVTYTIEVYSNKYSCIGEMFRTFTVTTPIYNYYSTMQMCSENPDFYYCQEFVSSELISYSEFLKTFDEYNQNKKSEESKTQDKNKKVLDKIKEFYQDNKIIINSIIVVIIVAGVATTVILVKKKRSRVL